MGWPHNINMQCTHKHEINQSKHVATGLLVLAGHCMQKVFLCLHLPCALPRSVPQLHLIAKTVTMHFSLAPRVSIAIKESGLV